MNGTDDVSNTKTMVTRQSDCTVLLVDGSETSRRSASDFLSQAGHTVVTAVDGFDAFAKVVEHAPSLVFVDISMPGLDGYQTCALIKNNADYRDTPVVLCSANDALFDKARARMVAGNGYLSKPFTAQSLLNIVNEQLERTEIPDAGSVTDDTTATADSGMPAVHE